MRFRYFIFLYSLIPIVAQPEQGSDAPPVPYSDGRVLHVDFENYVDNAIGLLNAGVRQLGDPFTEIEQGKVEVVQDSNLSFEGNRCAYVFTDDGDERGQFFLQRPFDAPEISDEVAEFVFRVTADRPVDLEDFLVWSAFGYKDGPAGITLLADGETVSGTYSVRVEGSEEPIPGLENLDQQEWLRFVLARSKRDKTVNLWVGPPEVERWAGRFPDFGPERPIGRVRLGDLHEERTLGSGYWDNIRIGMVRDDGDPAASPEIARDVGEEKPEIVYPIRVGTEKQLFVDGVVLERMEGVQRNFHQVAKHPDNPLVVPEKPWEVGGKWFVPYEVVREKPGEKLRIWYGSYRRSENKLTYTCVVESEDGLEWRRPQYGLFDFEGSKENNIVWEGRIIRPLYDPRDPDPSRRYKGMMRSAGFTPGFSPDGVHWTLESEPAIEQAYDATIFSWDPVGEKWVACVKIFRDGKRARGYAKSKDFTAWSDTYSMLEADERDHPEDQLYAMRILRYESVYIGLLKVYHVATDRCDLQLAFSRNGKHWERPNRQPFLSNSTERGAYDFGNLDEAGAPIRMGDELWFYYGGRSVLHYEEPVDTNGSICLATLRVDGFVSIDAGEEGGTIVTKPLVLSGDSLYLNADAEDGELSVEVLEDQAGADVKSFKPISSFTMEECEPVVSDSVRQKVVWKDSKSFSELGERTIRLRFHLRRAKLFSFWTE